MFVVAFSACWRSCCLLFDVCCLLCAVYCLFSVVGCVLLSFFIGWLFRCVSLVVHSRGLTFVVCVVRLCVCFSFVTSCVLFVFWCAVCDVCGVVVPRVLFGVRCVLLLCFVAVCVACCSLVVLRCVLLIVCCV